MTTPRARAGSSRETESWMATLPWSPWPASAGWDEAMVRLRRLMQRWISEAIDRHRSRPWEGIHDEGTFASAWPAYYLISGDPAIPRYLKQLRDEYRAWAAQHQYHGYWAEQEVHHGPENHLYFQTRLWGMDPEDPVTIEILEDLAHHLGNWIAEVPPWYDWDKHLFRSSYLGTRRVNTDPPHDVNVTDCLRLVLVALVTHRATGSPRYLDWAMDYGTRWAEAVLSAGRTLPLGLHAKLGPADIDAGYLQLRAKGLGAAPTQIDGELARVESYVSAGAIDAFLDLWRLTREDLFLRAAERLLDPLVPTLADSYAQASGALLAKYRRWTGCTSLDERIVQAVGPPHFEAPAKVVMDIYPDWQPCELVGIGRRKDMPLWAHKLSAGWLTLAVGPSPAALCLAYTITGEEAYVCRALDLASVRLQLAMATFTDGRDHGCAGQSVSAIVRGNGREAGYGHVTACLYPLLLGAHDFTGVTDAEVEYARAVDGAWRPGLPAEVAGLIRLQGARACLKLVNRSDESATVRVRALRAPGAEAREAVLAPQAVVEMDLPSTADLSGSA